MIEEITSLNRLWRTQDQWFLNNDQRGKSRLLSCELYRYSKTSPLTESWSNSWDISFRRHLNDCEIDRGGTTVICDQWVYRSCWKAIESHGNTLGDGRFTVNKLNRKELGTRQGLRLARWRHIWTSQAPTMVKCFVWLVVKRACLTREVLQKKSVQLVSRCSLCNETNETNSLLFPHCRVRSNMVWFPRLKGNSWTEHTADLLSCWIRRGGSKSQKKWWRIFQLANGGLWTERNEVEKLADMLGFL